MSDWVIDGDVVRFVPDAGWKWSGWEGTVKISAPDRGLSVGGRPVVLESDLRKLASALAGKNYSATGFDDSVGVGLHAQVDVQGDTLDQGTTIDGSSIALAKTKGTFVVTCVPSLKAGTPPIPDPHPGKRGRWYVDRTHQNIANSQE